ncbi:MAG: acyl-CoA dehydrogenase [Dehalococcoidia bacterium]|nr:acyl-CoA dehydrogenase [Dehalococcoidia bacterium]
MDLGYNEEQELLKKSAREFLQVECTKKLVRAMEEDSKGYSPELWKKMASLGWQGLVVPEKYGGSGLGFLDLCLLLEEHGRYLLPGPYFSTTVLAGLPLAWAGTESQKRRYLAGIASGELIMTLALTEPSARWDAAGVQLKARAVKDGYVLNGTKLFVQNANVADAMIVAARTRKSARPQNGITLFLVEGNAPGVRQTALKTIASDRQSEVVFRNVRVSKTAVLGEVNKGWQVLEKALQYAAAAEAARMVGMAQQSLDMSVDYAKNRVQFGRPIGSFQAIQHKCADMVTNVDGARYITYLAAWKLTEGEDAALEVSMAKAWCSDALRQVSAQAQQIHGGIGFTKEYDLQLYFRRIKAAEIHYGDADFHRERVAQLLGL